MKEENIAMEGKKQNVIEEIVNLFIYLNTKLLINNKLPFVIVKLSVITTYPYQHMQAMLLDPRIMLVIERTFISKCIYILYFLHFIKGSGGWLEKNRRKECKSSLRSVANTLYRNIVGRLGVHEYQDQIVIFSDGGRM